MILSKYQLDILKSRYLLPYENSWDECIERVSTHIAKAEDNNNFLKWKENFIEIMKDMDFIPGGRILYGSGRKSGAMLNCFAMNIDDNRYSIAKFMHDMYLISTSGGGLGANYSNIRPKGYPIQGIDNIAPGIISEIRKIDAIGEQIKCGGARRVALLAALSVNHPDILEFLEVKLDKKELNNHNISVLITDEFIKAIKKDKPWYFEFGGKNIDKNIRAKDIWNKIITNAIISGEPGILFIDRIRENFSTDYFEEFACTNPCGELPLPNHGSCCLGSVNLSNMYDSNKNDINWHKLSKTIRYAVRFLDNVITMNVFPIPECKTVAEKSRRIGLGVMGLHYLLIKMGLKYGKPKSLEFLERLFTTIRNEVYEASIDLAGEKSSFPLFDYEIFSNKPFIKNLPTRLIRKMKKNGIRNGMLLTCPPTGTTSQLANTSSGIEPIFAPIYKRKYRDLTNNGENKEEILVDSLFYQYYIEKKNLENFVSVYDINPEEHIIVQSTIQQYIDGSISKTVILPEDYNNIDDISNIIFEYSKHIKGITLYRQNSRGQEPLTPIKFSKDNINELISKATNIFVPESNCSSGMCNLS